MLLNLIIILQEKLLKEMNTLWELIQELKNNVTEEIKKTHSFKVRMKKMFFNYYNAYNHYTALANSVYHEEFVISSQKQWWFQMVTQ